jgi:hypothetical protein
MPGPRKLGRGAPPSRRSVVGLGRGLSPAASGQLPVPQWPGAASGNSDSTARPGCHCQWQVGNQEPGERRSLVRSEPRGSSIQTRPACQQAATILGMQLRLPRGGAGVFLQTRQHSQRRMRPRAVGPQRGHGARLPTSVSPALWPRSWQLELVTAEPRNAAIALLMSVLHKLLVYCPGFRARMRVKIGSAMATLLLRQ